MPFRGHDGDDPEYLRDPFARFVELEAALETGRGPMTDRVPQRLASVALLLMPGEAADIAARARSYTERFGERLPWHALGVPPAVQLLFASVMLRHEIEPEGFVDQFEAAKAQMRKLGMRRAPVLELVACLALRIVGGAEIRDEQVARMHAIHEGMKRHHWWLTGPDDYPMAALLTTREGAPETLAERAHLVYGCLRERGKVYAGDPLQTASNILALADAEPEELAERYVTLTEALRARDFDYGLSTYDDVAMLCFLPRRSETIADSVATYYARVQDELRWYEKILSTNLATNLVFVHTVGDDPRLAPLADLKTIFDMLWVQAARG